MKSLLIVSLVCFSLSSFAEVCKSADYKFEISKDTISFKSEDAQSIKLKIVMNKTLKPGYDLRNAVSSMSSESVSDSPITEAQAALIAKITLQASAGSAEIVGMAYAKAFDKKGNLVARFMMSEDGYYRCL